MGGTNTKRKKRSTKYSSFKTDPARDNSLENGLEEKDNATD